MVHRPGKAPRKHALGATQTWDRVHGRQQLALFHAHYDSRCFLPIHIYEAGTGKPIAVILRPGNTPDGAQVVLVLRHLVRAIRARWPKVEILIRGDSPYGRPEAPQDDLNPLRTAQVSVTASMA